MEAVMVAHNAMFVCSSSSRSSRIHPIKCGSGTKERPQVTLYVSLLKYYHANTARLVHTFGFITQHNSSGEDFFSPIKFIYPMSS